MYMLIYQIWSQSVGKIINSVSYKWNKNEKEKEKIMAGNHRFAGEITMATEPLVLL